MTPAADTPAFVAWRRYPRGRWFQLAKGPTFAACWAAALDAMRGDVRSGETTVLASGRHPNDPPAARSRPTAEPTLFASDPALRP